MVIPAGHGRNFPPLSLWKEKVCPRASSLAEDKLGEKGGGYLWVLNSSPLGVTESLGEAEL